MSELGLIEMTRKRTRENINRFLSEPCFYCEGEGLLKSKRAICYEIFRNIEREAPEIQENSLHVRVHPDISNMLLDEENQHIEFLERKINKSIVIKSSENLHLEQFQIRTH